MDKMNPVHQDLFQKELYKTKQSHIKIHSKHREPENKWTYFLMAFTDVSELSKSKQVPDLRIGA